MTKKVSWTPKWKILPKPDDDSANEKEPISSNVDQIALYEVRRYRDMSGLSFKTN